MDAHASSIDSRAATATARHGGATTRSMGPVRTARTLIALMAAATLCLPAMAQWKWTDANGNAQYSDRPPPPGTPDSKVLLRPSATARPMAAPAAPASAASGPVLRTVDAELEAKRKKAETDAKQEAAAKAQAEADRVAKAKAENCNLAKSQAATLNDGIRIARVNAKGEREYLDDNQRAQEASRAQSVMATDCK
jgi:hypothetical protein